MQFLNNLKIYFMAAVGFGLTHLNLPTPAGISKAATIISVIVGTFLLWINSDNNLFPEHATHVISSLGALIIALTNALKPFFGTEITTTTVPTSEVMAIKNP